MKRNDSKFKEMVLRLQSGEITREQACEAYDVEYGTLCVWLGRSKLNDTIPKPDKAKKLAGAALTWNTLDADSTAALDAALVRVMAGEISALRASKDDPRINANTLAERVRKAKIAAGIPVRTNARR